MNLSEQTLAVLKNFSTIQPSIVVQPGNVLRTISQGKTIMAEAKVEENFTSVAGIYNLSRFLATHSLFSNPTVSFEEKEIVMNEGKKKARYALAETSMIVQPPQKNIDMPDCEITVTVPWDSLTSVLKAANVLSLPELAFVNRDGSVHLVAVDSKGTTEDSYGIDLGVQTEDDFTLVMRVENFKIMPADYVIKLSSKGLANFKSDTIEYWIAVEARSTYNKG